MNGGWCGEWRWIIGVDDVRVKMAEVGEGMVARGWGFASCSVGMLIAWIMPVTEIRTGALSLPIYSRKVFRAVGSSMPYHPLIP